MSEQEYHSIKKKVIKQRWFYNHFGIFLVGSFAFFIFNASEGGDVWFIYPVMVWFVAITIHYLAVFGFPGRGAAWEEKQIQKHLRKSLPPISKDNAPTLPDEELELKEFKKLRNEWEDTDFV